MEKFYKDVKEKLKENNIFFNINGKQRHKDEDIIRYDENVVIEPYIAFLTAANVWSMGSFSYSWSSFPINTKMGRYCSISRNITILGTRHPLEWLTTSSSTYDKNLYIFKKYREDKNVTPKTYTLPNEKANSLNIGNDVWIGENVVLKRNLSIGDGAVIAANSVVVKDVPPYAIVGGNPAKLIRYRFSEEQINKLLDLKWWDYAYDDIQDIDITNINSFIDEFSEKRFILEKFTPIPFMFK